MKKILLILTLLFSVVAGAMAQNDAMYVYRNDGVINAFLKSDVDSIRYSKVDLDSIDHPNYVVQEVWAVDSVYRIPLAVVDSVGFVTPSTIYKGRVVVLEGKMRTYIIGRDNLTLLFSLDTPADILPSKGDKLVSTIGDEYLPSAFVGKVATVNRKEDAIEVICDPVELTDVFERYYGFSSAQRKGQPVANSRAVTGFNSADGVISPGKLSCDLIDIEAPVSISKDINKYVSIGVDEAKARLTLSLTPVIKYSAYSIIEPGFPINLGVTIVGDYEVAEEFEFVGAVSGECDVKLFNKGIPIPEALVDINFELGLFLKAEASLSIEQEAKQSYRSVFHWEWASDGNTNLKKTNRFFPVASNSKGLVALKGSIGAGAFGKVGLAFIATSSLDIAEINLRVDGGVKVEGTMIPYRKDVESAKTSTDIYEQIKNQKVGKYWFYGVSAEANLFDWSISKTLPDLGSIKLSNQGAIEELNTVPLFSATSLTRRSDGLLVALSEASGDVQPMNMGFALFKDDDMSSGEYKYCVTGYEGPSYKMSSTFAPSNGAKYKVYPLVKALGMELLASPAAELSTIPPKVTNFEQTGSSYSPKAEYVSGGQNYKYKFDVATTVDIESTDGVYDWGYAYESSDGKVTHISLKNFSSPYTDTRYAYYRNEPSSSVRLYGYVRYSGDGEYYYDEPQDFTLKHEEEGNVLLCDSIITYNVDGSFRSRRINSFNENGNWTGYVEYDWTDGQWVNNNKYEIIYNENGKETSYADYLWEDGQWIGSRKTDYTYDANGYIASYVVYLWEDGQWIGSQKTETTHDANGNETSYAHYNWEDGHWVGYFQKEEKTYDASGNETSLIIYYWENGRWVAHYKQENTNDINGNIKRYVNYGLENGQWVLYGIGEYTYDTNGRKTSFIYHGGKQQDGTLFVTTKYVYTYDENGNCIRVYYDWEDGQLVLKGKDETTYDANGYETSYATYFWEDGQWVGQHKYESTYDASGYVTSLAYYHWEDGQWVGETKREYTHDANGNSTSYAGYHWEDGQWVGESKYEHYFDETGKKTGGVYYIWQDGQWQLDSYDENFWSMHFIKNLDTTSRALRYKNPRMENCIDRPLDQRPTGLKAIPPYDYQDFPINNHRQTPPSPMMHNQ